MDIHDIQGLLTTIWVIWFFVLFGGIVVWALRPGRPERFERARTIPLRDAE